MELTPAISKRNFYALIWHAGFLAFAGNFIDIDTVIPAMLIDAGGTSVHIGILTAIMMGGSSFTQLIFAPFISNYAFKKKFLLLGINSRILALLSLGLMLYFSARIGGRYEIVMIFLLITVFSLGGAFANISYTDILGKSLEESSRKSFFSIRQVITSSILLGSVFLARHVLNSADYPINYAYMFFVGFLALTVASMGFYMLKEVTPSQLKVKSPGHFFRLIKNELRQNKKLGYYLGFINTMGISTTLLPFVILYASEHFGLQSKDTGNYLLFKVIGGVFTGLLLFIFSGKFKYRYLLFINVCLAFFIPLIILSIPGMPFLGVIFFIGGITYASNSIVTNGILLEVSQTGNRALYTGIAGAGNVLPALFPLLGGVIIKHFGFKPFFILFMIVILTSLFFIFRLKCIH